MRLIDAKTLCLTPYHNKDQSNKDVYAILSHTWEGDEEITFQEMIAINGRFQGDLRSQYTYKKGWAKIRAVCAQALKDNISYVWIDTCCINKADILELGEAINSMYVWYQKATVCYAYLYDLDVDSALATCRWFTRGWCLQELIAPPKVEFFNRHWTPVGSKTDLADSISAITHIPQEVLLGNCDILSVPVARRMSWISKRVTTREEDMAYCLLGIFGISMPMLYGEGPRAFLRLQEHILMQSPDLSIFAFEPGRMGTSSPFCNLFAAEPKLFQSCGELTWADDFDIHSNPAFTLTNRGLYFLQIVLEMDPVSGLYRLPLRCKMNPAANGKPCEMLLRKVGSALYARVQQGRKSDTDATPQQFIGALTNEEAYIVNHVTPSIGKQLGLAGKHAIHFWSPTHSLTRALQVLQRTPSLPYWDSAGQRFLTRGMQPFRGFVKFFPALAKEYGATSDETTSRSVLDMSGSVYIACGLASGAAGGRELTPWVQVYVARDWNALSDKYGIFTGFFDPTRDEKPTHCAATLKSGSGVHLRIEVGIDQVEEPNQDPFFRLTLKMSSIVD